MQNRSINTFVIALSLFLLNFWLNVKLCSAQDTLKQEKEERVKQKDMPKPIITLLSDWLKEAKKIRYYRETDGSQKSYEVKLTRKNRRFSVEFDSIGTLMDIEELVTFQQLPTPIKDTMNDLFERTYDRYKIKRTQRQYLPEDSESKLLTAIDDTSDMATENINYELEIDVKENSMPRSYELLFNSDGRVIRSRRIVRRSLDNLLY